MLIRLAIEYCMHDADFCTRLNIKHQWEFCKVVWLHKLHQNVWHRVSGLCPDPRGAHDRKEKRRIDGGREVASGLDPQDLWQIAATGLNLLLMHGMWLVQHIRPLSFVLGVRTGYDTNRPSAAISCHITVDLYGTLRISDVDSVDAVYIFTRLVDVVTVTWLNWNIIDRNRNHSI